MGLLSLLDRFEVASATLSGAAHAVAEAKEDLVSDTLACMDGFNNAVDGLLVRVEEYRGRWLAQVHLLSQAREKVLEAQADLLSVSAGQLAACVSLGRAALASGDDERVWGAARTARGMEGLLTVPTRLCTATRSAVVCDMSAAWTCLEVGTRLQHFEVDASRSSVSGDGLTAFAKGRAARNVIRVTCMDSHGEKAGWAGLEDAEVGLTLNGATWQVASAVFTKPGVLQVTYVVEEVGLQEAEVGVSLRGVTVPGGPWLARTGFLGTGVHIANICVGDAGKNTGVAVSADGSVMVVCNGVTHQLSVCQTEDRSHVRSFGRLGAGPGEFDTPRGLCMTAHDTVLVSDAGNQRIQEVTLEGVHVKFIPVDNGSIDVSMHGDVVAVITPQQAMMLHGYIGLYSYTTGALIRKIQDVYNRAAYCICFAPNGEHLAIGGWGGPITLMSVDGQSARDICPNGFWAGVAFTCTGNVVGINRGAKVFSATDGKRLHSWGIAEDGYATVSGNRLYVLQRGRVQVFQ